MQLMGPMAQCLDHLLIKKSRYTYSTHTRNARGYRFYFPENMFDGPTYNRDNWCFCPIINVEQSLENPESEPDSEPYSLKPEPEAYKRLASLDSAFAIHYS